MCEKNRAQTCSVIYEFDPSNDWTLCRALLLTRKHPLPMKGKNTQKKYLKKKRKRRKKVVILIK